MGCFFKISGCSRVVFFFFLILKRRDIAFGTRFVRRLFPLYFRGTTSVIHWEIAKDWVDGLQFTDKRFYFFGNCSFIYIFSSNIGSRYLLCSFSIRIGIPKFTFVVSQKFDDTWVRILISQRFQCLLLNFKLLVFSKIALCVFPLKRCVIIYQTQVWVDLFIYLFGAYQTLNLWVHCIYLNAKQEYLYSLETLYVCPSTVSARGRDAYSFRMIAFFEISFSQKKKKLNVNTFVG